MRESGNLVLEALDVETEAQVLQKTFETPELWLLDDKLNWWLSEVATYEPTSKGSIALRAGCANVRCCFGCYAEERNLR